MYYTKIDLPQIGMVWVAKSEKGITRVTLGGTESNFVDSLPGDSDWRQDPKQFTSIKRKLLKYARGKRTDFKNVRTDVQGTNFQKLVWRNISKIGWGETRSYAWLAHAARRPKAHRAAANACGANPLAIVVPCHRVITSNGKSGGFSCGLKMKKTLHKIEGII